MKAKTNAGRLFLVVFAVATLAAGVVSAQERVVWFPYANCGYGVGSYSAAGSWWGQRNNNFMWQMNTDGTLSTTANCIWNNSKIFYEETPSVWKSRYQNQGGDRPWQIYITNPTTTDYTLSGGVDRRIKVYIYGSNGTKLDEASAWSDGSTFLKWQYNSGPDIVWDAADDCFKLSVPAGYTAVVANMANGGQNEMVMTPATASNAWASVKVSQPQGGMFHASMCGQGRGHWRRYEGGTSYAFSAEWQMGTFRYNGIDISCFEDGNRNTVELPYTKEEWDPNSLAEWSTHVHVINADSVPDTIMVLVFRPDNTLIKTATRVVQPGERFSFAPSQFTAAASDNEFKVRIVGNKPACMAVTARWPLSGNSVRGYPSRLEAGAAANFVQIPNLFP